MRYSHSKAYKKYMDVWTVCLIKFINSCILLSFGPIVTKLGIFPKLNVLFLALWVSCCLSHNKRTRTQACAV